jgi:Ca-activated chloride channel family protein
VFSRLLDDMMPHFTHPWALLLVVLVPLAAWRFARGSRGAWLFSDQRLLPSVLSWRARSASWGGLWLRVLGLVLTIVALAGPRWADPQRIETEGIAIAMVVDVSVSMDKKDFTWQGTERSRLLGVKTVFRLFVEGGKGPDDVELKGRKSDLIALVTFATHPETACPLTLEHAPLLAILDAQEPRIGATEGTTNTGDAIVWALHVLQQAPTKRKVIVFLTDGESNVKDKLTPRQAAQLAANLNVPIYAIDASPTPMDEAQEAAARDARAMMQTLARMTDGDYFRAQDGRGLLRAYESIDQMERDRIPSFQYRRFHEGYLWFALAALGTWFMLVILEATLWRRVP